MKSDKLNYRPDIDGLRAIAVLSVVFFHAWPQKPIGGFVGVDVFFVISGYLITTIIVENLNADRFSFSSFYSRRVRRIFPALMIVLATSLAIGWIYLFPDEYRILGKHILASIGFVANFMFWSEANYFDVKALEKPLLHLWSLSIEEQYYLLYPAILWSAWKARVNLMALTAIGLGVSFAACVYLSATNPTAAFYSPLTRSWELLSGGLLAILVIRSPSFARLQGSTAICAIASIVGILLLGRSFIKITPASTFPGWLALMPTAGTVLLIAAGPATWINRNILASRMLVWIGLISYPLYLWHWPLLSFAYIREGQMPSFAVCMIVVAASVVLAAATYRFVEVPIRMVPSVAAAAGLGATAICVFGFGLAIFETSGFGFRFGDQRETAEFFDGLRYDPNTHIEERNLISQNQCNFYDYAAVLPTTIPRPAIAPECYQKQSPQSVMLWGDSHAAHLYSGLKQTLPNDVSVLLVFASGCKPNMFSESELETNRCHRASWFAMKTAREQVPDVVILASDSFFDVPLVRRLALELKGVGVKHVIAAGLVPHWSGNLYRIVFRNFWPDVPRRIKSFLDRRIRDEDLRSLEALTADEPFEYISMFNTLCDSDGCLSYLGDDLKTGLVTFDNAHLRPKASEYVARNALTPMILRDLERRDGRTSDAKEP